MSDVQWAARPLIGEDDRRRITHLVLAHPAENVHVCDLPYRLCSTDACSTEDARIWQDLSGNLLAFAIVQYASFGTLDYFIRPECRHQGIESAMMEWAFTRFQVWTDAAGRELSWWLESSSEQPDRLVLAEAYDFVRDSWHTIHFQRPLSQPIPASQLPEGFTLRPLAGSAEVELMVALHRAAFGSENMTVAWRRATLAMPQYNPELDLVIVAPDGQLAAFCLGWLCSSTREAQVEPMGVHPNFQQLGLGSALLNEQFRCMRTSGAENAIVETYSLFEPAIALYTSVGYRSVHTIEKYARDFVPTTH